jgi:hypothetical protein
MQELIHLEVLAAMLEAKDQPAVSVDSATTRLAKQL